MNASFQILLSLHIVRPVARPYKQWVAKWLVWKWTAMLGLFKW